MNQRLLQVISRLLLFALLGVPACSASLSPTSVVTVGQPSETASLPPAIPTGPPPVTPTFTLAQPSTPIPTFAPMPRSYVPPQPDPTQVALRENLVATVEPQLSDLSTSPDGRWRVELLTYPCTVLRPDMLDANAYEVLRITGGDDELTAPLADRLLNCGGLGAYGLGEIAWSPDSKYYYFTDAREGVPDGGSLGWMRPMYRYNTITEQVDILGPAVLSPDSTKIAASEVWADGQWWFAPLALGIWDISGERIARFETHFAGESSGSHRVAWSPSGQELVYVETECLPSGKCASWLYFVDLIEKTREPLLEDWQPAFEAVSWEESGRLMLTDSSFEKWVYDIPTAKVERLP